MKKETVLHGMINLIRKKARELKLTVEDRGTGHAFDNSFWKGLIEDDSGIPNIKAKSDQYSIELRSFWGSPEIDIRQKTDLGEELLIFHYSDYEIRNGEYQHTGDYHVGEVRVDSHSDYRSLINEVYKMIDYVEGEVNREKIKTGGK